jgi:hypothetical protein
VPDAAPSGVVSKLDSCALLTQMDAEELLGASVATPSTNDVTSEDPSDPRAMSQCAYSTTGSEYKSVSVLVRRGSTPAESLAGLQQIREENTLGSRIEPVTGLGDEAFWAQNDYSDQLTVAQGQFMVIASADLGEGISTLDTSKAVVQRVLARLP